ncbi:pseudouridine synthase [Emticicia sp.]|uniref:pseudouridine synthase n=1 Tax=Emticicia sp. TaxID=1930953 RepID=UPI0037509F9B
MRNSNSGRPPRPRTETKDKNSSSVKKSFSTDRASYPNQRREDDRKPFGEKRDTAQKPFGNNRPYQKREDSNDRRDTAQKPFGNDRPYQKREDDKKPFGEKRDTAQKPFGNDRPYQRREDDKKPFGEKRDAAQKPFGNDRPYQRREDDKKPFGEKRDAAQKPFSSGQRNIDRPFQKREDSGKPFGDKPKSFSDERPAHPFKKRDESGRATSNDRKNAFSADKPRFQKNEPFKPKENQATSSRINAPDYDEEKLKSRLSEKVQKKLLKEEKTSSPTDSIRLNRYISNAGVASRRDADQLIAAGEITVNGKVIIEMGYQVKPDDVVKYGKKILNREKMVYLLLNKPKDFITTTEDPDDRRTVMDLVKNACPERIYPVGRLDRNTTGLLLLTNDGELAEKLSHPSHEIKKIYQAELDRPISEEDFEAITNGIELEDGFIKPDELALVTPDAEVVGIKIHSGKNRIVRRIFESLGYEVMKLDRTTYAGLDKKDLPRGKWRFLTEKEVIRLKYMI